MPNLNVYLDLCSSEVDYTLGCGTLEYLVLTAHPAVFNTQCDTVFCVPTNMGIHPVMTKPTITAEILSKLVRNHKHKVWLFNKYHAVDRSYKKDIRKLTPKKYYKSLPSRIIGFTKFTSLEILTHLITEYSELEDEDVQDID